MYPTHHIMVSADVPGASGESTVALIRRTIRTALAEEGVTVPCEIDVLLTGDTGIHRLNREMRNVDRATDVLSFPMFSYEPGHPPVTAADADTDTGLTPLGDMAQAKEGGHSNRRELTYLVVHSVLHLLGYDHLDEGPQKARMREREEAILEKLDAKR